MPWPVRHHGEDCSSGRILAPFFSEQANLGGLEFGIGLKFVLLCV